MEFSFSRLALLVPCVFFPIRRRFRLLHSIHSLVQSCYCICRIEQLAERAEAKLRRDSVEKCHFVSCQFGRRKSAKNVYTLVAFHQKWSTHYDRHTHKRFTIMHLELAMRNRNHRCSIQFSLFCIILMYVCVFLLSLIPQ